MFIADEDKNFNGKGETQCGCPGYCSKCLTWAARGVLPTVLYSRSHYCLHFPDRDAGSWSHEAPRQGHTCTLSPRPTLPSSLTLKRTVREGRDCDNPAQTHPGQASLDQKCTPGSSSAIRGSGPPARPSPHLVRAELRSMYSNLSLKEHRCLHAPVSPTAQPAQNGLCEARQREPLQGQ